MILANTVESLTQLQWLAIIVCAFMIGIAKTGLPGVGILAVPLMALAFDAKLSVGMLLPILIMADIFAVSYHRHHGKWDLLKKLLPWTIIGILAGFMILKKIESDQLRPIIGFIVLAMVTIRAKSLFSEKKNTEIEHSKLYANSMGFLAGATTMMANAAGPVMTLYLLSMKMPKQKFIGTAAWFFFIVNWIKLPLMATEDMVTIDTIKINLIAFPAVVGGALAGIWLFKRIPQRLFNILALVLAAAAAIKLLSGFSHLWSGIKDAIS